MVTIEEKTILLQEEHRLKQEREELRHKHLMLEIKALADARVECYVRR